MSAREDDRLAQAARKAYSGFLSDAHALRAGQVWGIAMAHGLDLQPVVDEAGNYTAAMVLRSDRLPDGVTITLVVQDPEVTP